jgi:hypothetical protein
MKKYTNTFTAIRILVAAAVILLGLDHGLRMMNEPDTLSFIVGLIVVVVAIGAPIEYIYRKIKRK